MNVPARDRSPVHLAPAGLGGYDYVILYGKHVSASLEFYEQAFGLTRRLYHDVHGKAYGEVETGVARLAFASLELARAHLKQEIVGAAPEEAPLSFEIALVTADVPELYARALKAGATAVSEPEAKPWGQTVGCLRDRDGHLVELCTPLPWSQAEKRPAR